MRKFVLIALFSILTGFAGASVAAEFKSGDIVITDPWARASASKMMKAGAAFMMLKNNGANADRVIEAQSTIAKKTELHTHLMEKGVMKMRQVQAIDVPAGKMVPLKPGGLHVMFMGLHSPLKEGAKFSLTLVLEKAGKITFDVPIMKPGAKGHMGHKK
ncbi:MAG: copper chaperone PCu(A)C [Rhodospirillales bacterium]|nr:copper chaperone PCu(A)C [Alphaproteobacteria bacterium]MBL6929839.1 copper chaperone PCu(A)C [Rhodospirillales bacterium]